MALGWLWWRAGLGMVAGDAAALCVAGVKLGDIYLCGRRGAWRHLPSFCVAGVALDDIHLRFAWQAWRLWHWAGSGGALGLGLVAGDAVALCVAGVALGDVHLIVSRGRRGTWRHGLAFPVAGMALGDIYLPFAGLACHLWHWAGSGGVLVMGLVAGDAAALCVAGVALGDIHLSFSWRHRPWFCVAGLALGDIYILFSLLHTIFHIPLCHAQLFTYNLFYFSILHHILCLSFLLCPLYNICCSLLEEIDLWGYPVLYIIFFPVGENGAGPRRSRQQTRKKYVPN